MTALEERLSKTEYIYVLGFDGKPQMPTRRKRHVLKLLKTGRARIAEDIPFTIRLTYRNAPVAGNAGGGSGQDEHRSRSPVPAWRPAVRRRDRDQEQGDQETDD
jgi:hypothetical protein